MRKASINNILAINNKSYTPDRIMKDIAERAKLRSLERNITQKTFAARAGIPLATYRRFETTGEISLRNLALVGIALDASQDFSALFSNQFYQSINDVLDANNNKTRKRARQ